MMELILWRHAEAEDGIRDNERQLTDKGVKQAARMAKWLRQRVPESVVVLASPAQRTQQTARAFTSSFTTKNELGVAGSVQDVLSASGWPAREGIVIVVGHQPTLGETAALLLGGRIEPWHVKKGAVFWVEHHVENGRERNRLRVAITPDLL